MLAFGGLFGGMSTYFNRPLGLAVLAACAVGGGLLFAAKPRVQRLSRWTAGSSAAGSLVFFAGLLAVGVSIASAMLDRGMMLWCACLFIVAAAVLWRGGLRRREAEWERARDVNEREVLALRSIR